MEVTVRTTGGINEILRNVVAIGRQAGDLSIMHEKGTTSFNDKHWIFYTTDEDIEDFGETDEDK